MSPLTMMLDALGLVTAGAAAWLRYFSETRPLRRLSHFEEFAAASAAALALRIAVDSAARV